MTGIEIDYPGGPATSLMLCSGDKILGAADTDLTADVSEPRTSRRRPLQRASRPCGVSPGHAGIRAVGDFHRTCQYGLSSEMGLALRLPYA